LRVVRQDEARAHRLGARRVVSHLSKGKQKKDEQRKEEKHTKEMNNAPCRKAVAAISAIARAFCVRVPAPFIAGAEAEIDAQSVS
jgi:hypothetical protein